MFSGGIKRDQWHEMGWPDGNWITVQTIEDIAESEFLVKRTDFG